MSSDAETESVGLDVQELAYDDENERKFAAHRVDVTEVQEVFESQPRFFRNRRDRRASHVMMGPTVTGRLLVVPIEEWGSPGVWRPVTAFDASVHQSSTYRSRR